MNNDKQNIDDASWVGKHLPCPKCGSSDAASYNNRGVFHCFSCESNWYDERYDESSNRNKQESENIMNDISVNDTNLELPEGVYTPIKDRGISEETCKKYGVTCDLDFNGNIITHHYPYYDNSGQMIAVKTRQVSTKQFSWSGQARLAKQMFGQQLFGANNIGQNILFITEGCLDAMAVWDMVHFPAVSVANGATSLVKQLKDNYDFVNSFDKVFILMDNDKVGREALEQASSLFPPRKTFIGTADKGKGCKDPCDYLKRGLIQDFKKDMWWNAKQYIPDGIYDDPGAIWDEVKNERNKGGGHPYPWVGLNKMLFGMSPGELITVTAGSGSGKTSFLRELQYHLLKTSNERLGVLMLEETIGRSALGLMSIEANLPLQKPDVFISDEELKQYYDRTIGLGKISFYGGFKCFDIDTIKARIEYMIQGCDCKYIFLDHISILVSNQEVSDERRTLDAVCHCLAELAVSYNVCIIMVSHLRRTGARPHEEGGQTSLQDLRGSQGIAQLSFTVLGIERNQQAKDPDERNTLLVRVLKNRKFGETGPACKLKYDQETGRLTEIEGELEDETPSTEDKPPEFDDKLESEVTDVD